MPREKLSPTDLNPLSSRLTAISGPLYKNSGGNWFYRFSCECGGTIEAPISHVKTGKVTSCGCDILERREIKKSKTKIRREDEKTKIKKKKEAEKLRRVPALRFQYPYEHQVWYRLLFPQGHPWYEFKDFLADVGPRPGPQFTFQKVRNSETLESANDARWGLKSIDTIVVWLSTKGYLPPGDEKPKAPHPLVTYTSQPPYPYCPQKDFQKGKWVQHLADDTYLIWVSNGIRMCPLIEVSSLPAAQTILDIYSSKLAAFIKGYENPEVYRARIGMLKNEYKQAVRLEAEKQQYQAMVDITTGTDSLKRENGREAVRNFRYRKRYRRTAQIIAPIWAPTIAPEA